MENFPRVRLCALVLVGVFSHPLFAAAPLLEYKFDVPGGATVLNTGALGAAANGLLGGAVTYSVDTPSGLGQSLSFDGAVNFVAVPDAWNYGSALTVEAWIKPSAVNAQRILWDDYGNPGVVLAVLGGQLQYSLSTTSVPGPGLTLINGTITAGTWQHVAGVYDGSLISLYLNGVLVGSTALTGTIIDNSSSPAAVGRDNVASALYFAGLMDDFRLHESALLPGQLAGGAFAVPEGGTWGAGGLLVGAAWLGCRSSRRHRG